MLNVRESLGRFTGARHQHYISPSKTTNIIHFQARLLLHNHHSPVKLAPHHSCHPPTTKMPHHQIITTKIPHSHPLTTMSTPCYPIALMCLPPNNPLSGYTRVTKSYCVQNMYIYHSIIHHKSLFGCKTRSSLSDG